MKIDIPEIPEEDKNNPTVKKLIEIIQVLLRCIQDQNDQILRLKDEKIGRAHV